MRRLSLLGILTLLLWLEAVACRKCDRPQSELDRIDCHPDRGANEAECSRRGCCWQEAREQNELSNDSPTCFFPADFNCYNIKPLVASGTGTNDGRSANEMHDPQDDEADKYPAKTQQSATKRPSNVWLLERRSDCPSSGFHDDAKRLKMELDVYGQSIMNIKISEPDRHRFEPSLPDISLPARPAPEAQDNIGSSMDGSKQSANSKEKESENENENILSSGHLGVLGSENEPITAELDPESGQLRVTHQNSGKILFEIHLKKLIYSRRFVQLSTRLGSPLVYGLGQHLGESLVKSQSRTLSMFNYGHPPQSDGRSSYSSYPFYVNLVSLAQHSALNGSLRSGHRRSLMATGGLMLNSNAMDVVLRPGPALEAASITWRLVGGILNLFLFAGPEPHDVIRQYQSLVGRPALPPAWALGYHQSRLNYRQLQPIKQAWARTRSAGIPMESVWTDLDFLRHKSSYTLDNPELNELVSTLQDKFGMHYVTIVNPTISLDEDPANYEALKLATSMNLFAYNPAKCLGGQSSPALVNSWVERAALLDFSHSNIVPYLERILLDYKRKLNFDGLWLDMNEPELNFNYDSGNEGGRACANDEELQYWPGDRNLNDRTLCMAAEFEAGKHFDLHNLYAFYQSKAHYEALKAINSSRRPFVISRAQFVGQGKYSGSWLGDLGSTFEQMRWSLLGTIESSWFGQPLTGADICGFFGSTSEELCARWFSLGAFYPLARNHNDGFSREQDPAALGEQVEGSARVALLRRYSLLPYLYTLFYENHLAGTPVVSSMAFAFFQSLPAQGDLYELLQYADDQLVWGSTLVIAPVLQVNSRARHVQLPAGRWYDISIGLPGTDRSQRPYEALKSNWPTRGPAEDGANSECSERLEDLFRPIECLESLDGCLLRDLCTPLGAVNLFLRGGSILPTFRRIDPNESIGTIWRRPSFFLEIALDEREQAAGSLYWDSGESAPEMANFSRVFIEAKRNMVGITMLDNNHDEELRFDGFLVYGAKLEDNNNPQEERVYRNVRLVRSYDQERSLLICNFRSLTDEREDYIRMSQRETLLIKC